MATRNSYLAYKRDTKHLLYWMIHASNAILQSTADRQGDAANALNTTGQITVSGLLVMARRIAERLDAIPSTIFRLFRSVIRARSAAYTAFQQIASDEQDEETEKMNHTHKYFIDTLIQAFEILGGNEWTAKQDAQQGKPQDAENSEDIIFANAFDALNLAGPTVVANGTEDTSEEEDDQSQATQQKKRSGKGKKNKRGKKGKGKPRPAPVEEHTLENVPLESYRIIEDKDGLVTDYLLALYALFEEWIELRSYIQRLWGEVAYDGLNSATAGTLSMIAIAMIKRTQSAIFVDFPGHDSYETVMKTITRGNPDKPRSGFGLMILVRRPGSETYEEFQKADLDVKEQFSIYAYQDLVDFVVDFQLNRSGKPTKRMLAEIKNWDPHFNLQQASKEERIKWRRSYTINWLYDLVNVFSSIVVQRNTMKGEHYIYENVDWSVNGPWNQHRRLFGLNEFAGFITSLAMQKPGSDIRSRILPDHVFQLQCILDSLTVSRGWSVNTFDGHVLKPIPRNFRPRRDVDLFLDRKDERTGHGYLHAVDILKQALENDAMMHGEPDRHRDLSELLVYFQEDFRDWLGETKYMQGLATIPPSRFSNSHTNGLWEYSPFLCGVGLMEALELVFRVNLVAWDRIPEPMLLIHMHNMLVRKGYIKQPVGLYASLEEIFPTTFFANGVAPTSNFDLALSARIVETRSRQHTRQVKAGRSTARAASDIHGLLQINANSMYRTKSNLLMYRDADWNPRKILDADISLNPLSMLGSVRLGQTKQMVDPDTGMRHMERTDLVKRAFAQGMSEEFLQALAETFSTLQARREARAQDQAAVEATLPVLSELAGKSTSGGMRKNTDRNENNNASSGNEVFDLSGTALLRMLKFDIHRDVSGGVALSGVNYVWVTIRFMVLFTEIEEELKRIRHPLWVEAYESNEPMTRQKRVYLATLALNTEDDECLQVMAKCFQNPRAGFLNHIYWEDMDEYDRLGKGDTERDDGRPDCTVM